MTLNELPPFNLDLLIPSEADVKNIAPVKVTDIYLGLSKNFHPEGLFSTEIFGRVGEEKRNKAYSYINLHVPILHPVIYKAIIDLKQLNEDILSGSKYAIFNKDTHDFELSNQLEGETGYSFFISKLQELQFEERDAYKREFNIKLLNKYKSNCLLNKLIIMPAGLRDFTIDENNKPTQDEINVLYMKVIGISNLLQNINMKINTEHLDSVRYNLQMGINAIYDYITNMLEGKSKLIQAGWSSRKVYNTARNVATSYVHTVDDLNSPQAVSVNQTVIGLYMFLRNIFPLSAKLIRDTYLLEVFTGPNTPALLVNKLTLKKEMVVIDPAIYDSWMTIDGLEKIIAKYSVEDLRHKVIEIDNRYLGLIYKDDRCFKFFQDIDELPEHFDNKNVNPITLTELLYISIYKEAPITPGLITRYPVINYGSIYPSFTYLKTTVNAIPLIELDNNWEETDSIAPEFPIVNDKFFNSMAPSITHLARLGMDYDGDTASYSALFTTEAREEVTKVLNSKDYYVGVNGKMAFSCSNDVIDLVLANITG